MTEKDFNEADQKRRDELLRRLLKMPPQPRPKREREKNVTSKRKKTARKNG